MLCELLILMSSLTVAKNCCITASCLRSSLPLTSCFHFFPSVPRHTTILGKLTPLANLNVLSNLLIQAIFFSSYSPVHEIGIFDVSTFTKLKFLILFIIKFLGSDIDVSDAPLLVCFEKGVLASSF